MKSFNLADVQNWAPEFPAYYPSPTLTADDVLAMKRLPATVRLQVALREACLDKTLLRRFACHFAKLALEKIDKPDPRSTKAVEVAHQFAEGQATAAELAAACQQAEVAAREAVKAFEVTVRAVGQKCSNQEYAKARRAINVALSACGAANEDDVEAAREVSFGHALATASYPWDIPSKEVTAAEAARKLQIDKLRELLRVPVIAS